MAYAGRYHKVCHRALKGWSVQIGGAVSLLYAALPDLLLAAVGSINQPVTSSDITAVSDDVRDA